MTAWSHAIGCALPGKNVEAAHPACRKRQLMDTKRLETALLVDVYPSEICIYDWLKLDCRFSLS